MSNTREQLSVVQFLQSSPKHTWRILNYKPSGCFLQNTPPDMGEIRRRPFHSHRTSTTLLCTRTHRNGPSASPLEWRMTTTIRFLVHYYTGTSTASSVEQQEVQPTAYMDNQPKPSRGVPWKGLPKKTDQIRPDHTQSCQPGRPCDLESSVYHLALWKCSGIFRHTNKPTDFLPHAHHPPPPSLPPPNPP